MINLSSADFPNALSQHVARQRFVIPDLIRDPGFKILDSGSFAFGGIRPDESRQFFGGEAGMTKPSTNLANEVLGIEIASNKILPAIDPRS